MHQAGPLGEKICQSLYRRERWNEKKTLAGCQKGGEKIRKEGSEWWIVAKVVEKGRRNGTVLQGWRENRLAASRKLMAGQNQVPWFQMLFWLANLHQRSNDMNTAILIYMPIWTKAKYNVLLLERLFTCHSLVYNVNLLSFRLQYCFEVPDNIRT